MHIFKVKVHNKNGDTMKIKDIMSRKLITCEIDDNVLFVCNLMKTHDVGFILIMNKNKLYGVVTDRDLICDLADNKAPIKQFGNKNIVNIDENNEIKDALNLMKTNKIKRLAVTSQNKITGVISLSDIYNSDVDSETILETIKTIFAINRNNGYYDTDVNDFIL